MFINCRISVGSSSAIFGELFGAQNAGKACSARHLLFGGRRLVQLLEEIYSNFVDIIKACSQDE